MGDRLDHLVRSSADRERNSRASRRDETAALTLKLLDVAPRPEAVRHFGDPKVVNPESAEKATEDLGHWGLPPEGVSGS